ncbi:hypothetical protein FRX31_032399 [Thalictrum thalictroides]|uniref:Uncharacterized protein n=1 Tax=Thalictrum thalictroides TaxID=46969 RepID=A0A7J6UZB1_THATH|nr:hypothetical protein FRX31_032399 [Thalictrum thalictroides]
MGKNVRCSNCKVIGHNKSTCNQPLRPPRSKLPFRRKPTVAGTSNNVATGTSTNAAAGTSNNAAVGKFYQVAKKAPAAKKFATTAAKKPTKKPTNPAPRKPPVPPAPKKPAAASTTKKSTTTPIGKALGVRKRGSAKK